MTQIPDDVGKTRSMSVVAGDLFLSFVDVSVDPDPTLENIYTPFTFAASTSAPMLRKNRNIYIYFFTLGDK